ncbi:MAG: class I adenylate-forming enzyme family protein [Vulcanimicrobiaceae bacterium]
MSRAGRHHAPTATLGDILRRNAALRPHVEAVTDGTKRLSWRELFACADRAAQRLASYGMEPGERIVVALPNSLEGLLLYWACALGGVIFVGASPRLGRDDLHGIITHCGAKMLFLPTTARIAELELRGMRCVPVDDDPTGFFTAGDLPAEDDDRNRMLDADATFTIGYTSGTLGPAKGAILSHGNLLWNAARVGDILRLVESDVVLLTVPITHIFGLSAGVLAAAMAGARTVLVRDHAAGPALDLCEWEGVTVHHGTPTMFVLELAAQARAPRDLSSLRTGIVAAAPVSPELIDAIRSELNCDVQIAWGLTETAPTVTMTRFDDPPEARRSSVGRPLPDAVLRIEPVAEDITYGEILVKSPGVFGGYFGDAQRTCEAFTHDGWFRTGDLGWIDDEGFLHLAGRAKEIIIRGGLHVFPEEVEGLIRTLPWIEAVAVVGIPDPVLGERTCACVVLCSDAPAPEDTGAAVRSVVGERLADFKVPDAVLRVPELPRSVGGKVLRRVLREDAIARLAAS